MNLQEFQKLRGLNYKTKGVLYYYWNMKTISFKEYFVAKKQENEYNFQISY